MQKQNRNTINSFSTTFVSVLGQLIMGLLLITIVMAVAVLVNPDIVKPWVE